MAQKTNTITDIQAMAVVTISHIRKRGERARARTTRATTDAQHDPHDRCDSSNSEKKTVPLIGEIHYAEYVSSDDEPSRSGSNIARSSKRLVEG